MSYDLSNLITQGFQNSSAARDNAFRNFAQGAQSVGEGVHALRQRSWNNENDRLMQEWYNMQAPQEDSEAGGKPNLAAMLDPELLRLNEMQRRLHNLKGHAKGLRTNYTPQDYLKLDAEAQAMEAARQKAEADAKKDAEEYERQLLKGLDSNDFLAIGALKEFQDTGDMSAETRNRAISAVLGKSGDKSDSVRMNFLGSLDANAEIALRNRLIGIADTEASKFGKQLKAALLDKKISIPELLGGAIATAVEKGTSEEKAIAQKMQKEVDKSFDDPIYNKAIASHIQDMYHKAQAATGLKHTRDKDYAPQATRFAMPKNKTEIRDLVTLMQKELGLSDEEALIFYKKFHSKLGD